MKTTWILSKIYFKELVGSFISKTSTKNGGEAWKKILFLLLPILFYPQVLNISYYFYSKFIEAGLGATAVSLLYLIAAIFSFFTVFSSVTISLGGDKALIQLISLPLKSKQIFDAKILLLYFLTMLETLYLSSPTAVFYAMDFGWHTLPITLLVAALIPVIPMSLALLVIMPYARVFAKSRFKKIAPYFFYIGYMVAYLIFMGSVKRMDASSAGSMTLAEVFYTIVHTVYPPAAWGGSLVEGNLLSGLYFLLISLAMLSIVYFVSGFFAGVVLDENLFSIERRGKAVLKTHSVSFRLIRRQFGILFSSHRFVLQCLGSLITMPILFIFYSYAGLFDFQSLARFVSRYDFGVVVIFIALFSPTLTSSIGISSVAREGKTFWENKVLPISAKQHVLSRFFFIMLLNLPVGLITALVAMITFDISVFETLFGVLAGIGYVTLSNSVDLIIDIKYPNLEWTNEMQAVKNSKTITIGIFVKIFIGVAIGYVMYYIANKFGVMVTIWSALISGMILGVLSFVLLMTKGVELFDKIES